MPFAFGQGPVANFSSNTQSGCAPLAVAFTDQSSGNPTEWNWEFSNGTLSNDKNPTVSFATPGTYSVKLVVRNANGIDQIERIDYITVYPSPVADFEADLRLGCMPVSVKFTDHSSTPSGTITKWEWEFGDGETSSQQNPSHTYTTTGFYTVSLRVTSSNGCVRRISRGRYIRVVDGVETNFSFSNPGTCKAPFSINFQNQSSGPGNITYSWNFGNGQTSTVKNPSTVYTAPGTYNVRLDARSDLGCSGSIEKPVTITQTNTDFTSPTAICLEQPVTFQNNSSATPVNSSWNFGDGTVSAQINPIKTFLTAGTYTVKLINSYSSCTDSVSKTVLVTDKPAVDFTVNDSSSCQAPFNVQFTDMTPGATSWLWDFGDGTTSPLQNPTHQYNSVGNYTVTLTAGTSTDCSNTITKTDLIKIQETSVSINSASGCIPFSYTPKATIQTLDSIATYLWDFGDGTTSNVKSPPPHNYPTEGKYTVSLTITTESGCTKTVTVPNAVVAGTPPSGISFTANPSNACASDAISFSGQAITSPGADVEWNWDFGDGELGSGQTTTHKFMQIGTLDVTLTVSNNGCPRSFTSPVTIRPPIAKFEYTVNCTNRSVNFSNTSLVDATATPLTYLWEMGDPANTQFTVATPPAFTYPGPGTYNAKLTVTNGTCTYTVTEPVILLDEKADFTINENPVCKSSTFTLSSINNNENNIKKYEWVVGGNMLADTTRSVTHRLSTNGTYDVSLTITDINGCTNTKTVSDYITVNGPTARFAPATTGACLNKAVTFNDLSTSSTAAIVKWQWNFGDSTPVQTFNAPPFTHTYSKAGRFPVTLVVTDANGCTDRYRLPGNLLVTNPLAGFRADTFYCPQSPLQFADTSSGAGLKYLWDFGDGGTSNLQNPTHSYPAGDAAYSVKLKITDVSGCADSIIKTDYIKIRSPKAAFDIFDTTSICPPLRTTFIFKGSDYKSFRWVFGDGGSSTLQNPSYFYGDYGHYTPKLYLTGPGGCVDSAQASVSLYDPQAYTKINYGPVSPTCNSLNVDFNLVVPPSFKFIFHFGDGAVDSSGATTLSHFYSRPSFNTPRIEIIDTISGCRVSINGRQRIDIIGALPLFSKDKGEFCDQGTVTFDSKFTTKNDPIISRVWTFGDGQTSNDVVATTHTFTAPGVYPVTLTVTTEKNCVKSYTDTVRVYRTPAATIQSRDTICVNVAEPINGLLNVADTAIQWQWNFGNGQTSSQQNTSAIYSTSGGFPIQLVTTNKIGCSSTATKNIYVAPLPTAVPVQEPTTILVGSGANILMNYTGNITSYNWMPATNLSCTDCPSPYANPKFSTKYTVQIEDTYGCKNSGNVTVVVLCNNQNFFIPNTFSPNGDGRNEKFYPKGTGLFRIKSMRIFNRWGEVVFEKKDFAPNDPSAGWNGMYNGKPASPDAYIYTMEILCDNNTVIPVKGNVTLLR